MTASCCRPMAWLATMSATGMAASSARAWRSSRYCSWVISTALVVGPAPGWAARSALRSARVVVARLGLVLA